MTDLYDVIISKVHKICLSSGLLRYDHCHVDNWSIFWPYYNLLLLDEYVTTRFPTRRCYSPDSRGAEFWSQDKFYGSFFISFQITFAFRLWPLLQSISAYQNGAQNTIYMIGNNLLLPMKWLLAWERLQK